MDQIHQTLKHLQLITHRPLDHLNFEVCVVISYKMQQLDNHPHPSCTLSYWENEAFVDASSWKSNREHNAFREEEVSSVEGKDLEGCDLQKQDYQEACCVLGAT